MINELFSWLLSFSLVATLIVIVVYQLVCLTDLELDHINPHDGASRINYVIVPEFVLHGALCCFFLVTGHWLMLLLCIPYLCYNVKMYMDKKHLVDATEIFRLLKQEKKKRLIKLGYLVIIFMFSLFWLIWSALGDHEHIYDHDHVGIPNF